MKVKRKLLRAFMKQNRITAEGLARRVEIPLSEVKKLLKGKAVDEAVSLKFIVYFGAGVTEWLIDWEAIGRQDPFACEADGEN